MSDFLVFQLYGPMASWGTSAVGESRHSDAYPSKSAVMGLSAAALGIRRSDDAAHERLCTAYGYGVKVASAGALLRDYHTTQAPPKQKNVVHYTRRDELRASKLGTILSAREYRCDAYAVAALWALNADPPYSLQQLADALNRPRFVLYLGRKSCPLGLPLQPGVIEKESLKAALDADLFHPPDGCVMPKEPLIRYGWETPETGAGGQVSPGMEETQQISRYDAVLSRKRWQFEPRTEYVYLGKEA